MPCSSKALPAHKARETYIRFVAARGRNRAQLFLGCRGNAEIEVRSKPRAQAETVLNSAQSNRTSVRPHRNFATASATQGAILKRNTVYHIYRRAPGSKGCGERWLSQAASSPHRRNFGRKRSAPIQTVRVAALAAALPRPRPGTRGSGVPSHPDRCSRKGNRSRDSAARRSFARRVWGRRARGSLHYLPIRIRKSRFRGRRSRFSARTGRTTRRAGGLGQAHRLCFLKQHLFGLLPSATACLVSKPWVRYKGISCRFLAKIKSQHTWLPT